MLLVTWETFLFLKSNGLSCSFAFWCSHQFSYLYRIVLRNYIAQSAIDAAERGDFREVRRVLKMLENPYTPLDQSPDVLMSPAGAGADSLAVGAGNYERHT